MAEQEPVEAQAALTDEEEEVDTNYKAPAFKSTADILEQDKDDESLNKYKEKLLKTGDGVVIIDPHNPKRVIVKEMLINVEGKDPQKMDLTDTSDDKKKGKIALKEGSEYTVQINFGVQKEIVSGLKYCQAVYRKGIRVEKSSYMLGSYAPNKELKYVTEAETAPSGMLGRGEYKIKSKFTDDDKNIYLEWEWCMEIKKEVD